VHYIAHIYVINHFVDSKPIGCVFESIQKTNDLFKFPYYLNMNLKNVLANYFFK